MGCNIRSLSDWQNLNPDSLDKNSVEEDPVFEDIAIHQYTPTAWNIDNMGTAIAGITEDYNGTTRKAIPDAGAFEFSQPRNDAGIVDILGLDYNCPGLATVSVTVKNFGLDTLTQVTLNWTINGNSQTPNTQFVSVVPGDSTDLVIGTLNMTGNNNHDFVCWSSLPNNVADSNMRNDTSFLANISAALIGGNLHHWNHW